MQTGLLEALVNSKLTSDAAAAAIEASDIEPGNYTVRGLDGRSYLVTIYKFQPPDVRGPVRRLT